MAIDLNEKAKERINFRSLQKELQRYGYKILDAHIPFRMHTLIYILKIRKPRKFLNEQDKQILESIIINYTESIKEFTRQHPELPQLEVTYEFRFSKQFMSDSYALVKLFAELPHEPGEPDTLAEALNKILTHKFLHQPHKSPEHET